MSNHSAIPQALGYIYQIFDYALYVILKDKDQYETQMFIEKLDDIEVGDGKTPRECLQIKRSAKPLTNRSVDFWKTIWIWSELLRDNKISLSHTKLTLVTTAKVSDRSIGSFLCPNSNRNPKRALEMMRQESQKPTDSLKKSFSAFTNLSSQNQSQLVEAIQILDKSPDFDEIRKETTDLFIAVRDENKETLYEKLIGWWHKKVIQHFQSYPKTPISRRDVINQINSIRDKLVADDLPIHFAEGDEEPPRPLELQNGNPQFVRQLEVIRAKRSIDNAIWCYIRAYAQQSRWVEMDGSIANELTNYNRKLIRYWKTDRDLFLDIFEDENDVDIDDANVQQLQRIGKKIYQKICSLNIPIRRQVTEQYVTLGSYHILANQSPPDVGWHPKFNKIFINIQEQQE